jgi:acetyl/propionyl-CoA carboxylase alpha subunit
LVLGAIEMMHVLRLAEASWECAVLGAGQARRLLLPDQECRISLEPLQDGVFIVLVDGVRFVIHLAGTDDRRYVHIDGEVFEVSVLDPLTVHAQRETGALGLQARAPMPGSVVAYPVCTGATVRPGDILVIIESMKLEVAIKAERAGTVQSIHVDVGKTFEKGAVLVTLAAARGD